MVPDNNLESALENAITKVSKAIIYKWNSLTETHLH